MHPDLTPEQRESIIRYQAERLIADAAKLKVRVTISLVSPPPYAMGNLLPVIETREIR